MNSDLIFEGGDERIILEEKTNKNKYHINPLEFNDTFQRGSCTCGMLNNNSINILNNFDKNSVYQLRQTDRILKIFNIKDEADIFFAPSGTDLIYWPLFFTSILNEDRKILNIVSCEEELGSGVLYASKGKYFSKINQFGDQVKIGELICEKITPDVIYLKARCNEGNIIKQKENIKKIINNNLEYSIILTLVYGSKSGINDDITIIDDLKQFSNVTIVIDICQMRTYPSIIKLLISKGVIVMITGSKFFEAPPFCGAIITPKIFVDKILQINKSVFSSYNSYLSNFSIYDIPYRLYTFNAIKNLLTNKINYGLILRWEIAINEMESFFKWSDEESSKIIEEWNFKVKDYLKSFDCFKLIPQQDETTPSIISFKIIKNNIDLEYDELLQFYKCLINTYHKSLSCGKSKIFIGQPVKYKGGAFIRIAIGSSSVRYFLESGNVNIKDDIDLINIIRNYISIHKVFDLESDYNNKDL